MAHSRFRYLNCQVFQPNLWTSIALAICRGVRGAGWPVAARCAVTAARVTAGAGPGGAALPVTRAAALVVVLARAITAPASAIVIGTEMRGYVRVRDNWHLWSGAP